MRLRLEPGAASDGFTIMELMVVVAIVGLMIAASTLALQNVMKSELRSAASKTASSMRYAFDRATMTGNYVRLALDLDKGELWLEASEDRVSLRAGSEQHATSEKEQRDGPDGEPLARRRKKKKQAPIPFFAPPTTEGAAEGEPAGEGDAEGGDEEGMEPGISARDLLSDFEADMSPIRRAKANFTPIKGMLAKKIKLPKNVAIYSVVTPRMIDPVEKGTSHVYFFPQGHSEPAIIHLKRKDNDDYYSVVLHPLTGQARVYPCLYQIPEEFGISDDKRGRQRKDPCADLGGI